MKNVKIVFICAILFILLCVMEVACFAEDTAYVWSSTQATSQVSSDTERTEANTTEENFLNLDCGSAILVEQTTGKVLYSYNEHEQLYPASVTKLMSILLIMEQLEKGNITLETQIPCSENASSMGGSQIWLDPTERLTVDEMLKAICVNSANDCNVQLRHKDNL